MDAQRNPFLLAFEKTCVDRGDSPAIIAPDGTMLRSFRQIRDEARTICRSLGPPGRRVALHMENNPSWPSALLGVWMADSVAVPAEPSLLTLDELGRLTGIDAVLQIHSGALRLIDLNAASDRHALPPSTCLLKITSGTTSTARAIAFTGNQLLHDAHKVATGMRINPDDRHLAAIPMAHSYGLTNLFGLLALTGSPLVLCPDKLPRAIARAAEATGASVLPAVPPILSPLASLPALPPSIRLVISAGAPLPLHCVSEFHRSHHLKIHSFYGSSECGGICFDASDSPDVPEGFVGTPMPGVHIDLDPDGRPTIRTDSVGTAYLGEPAGTDLADGRFRPSDILEYVDRETGSLRITGRVNELINVGGRKVSPTQIECVLKNHPGVVEAVVFGVPAPAASTRSEEIVAAIWTQPHTDRSLLTARLPGVCAEALGAACRPRHVFFPVTTPGDARGKISRHRLREEFRIARHGGA